MVKALLGTSPAVVLIFASLVSSRPDPPPGIFGGTKIATNENTNGVRYAGPIVYTGEKPPIITFPKPPKHGFGGPGKPGPGKSVKYVPLPHHDLPVLIYQSDIAPPLHVVGMAPGPVASPPLGEKGGFGGSYKEPHSSGSHQFSQSSTYGAPPKDSYGAPPMDSYRPPKDSYGGPPLDYRPPQDSFGEAPIESYHTAKDNYRSPPRDSYVPPKDNYGNPLVEYRPPKETYEPSKDFYGSPSDSYGPPKDSYRLPKGSYKRPKDSYKTSYGPPKNSYGRPKSSHLPSKSKSSGRYKSQTKSVYGPPKSKHVKGDYGQDLSSTATYHYIPHKSKSQKGPMPHIIYTGHPPIHIFQAPIYMSPPKSSKGYGPPPKEDEGWVPSINKAKGFSEGAGTLEDSWSHGSETYGTAVPYTESVSEEKTKPKTPYYTGSKGSKAKCHQTTSSSSHQVKSHKPPKEGRRQSQHHGRKPGPSGGGIFSEIGEMWKTVMDSAIAGSTHLANAYGYNRPPPKQQKGHSYSKSNHKNVKYYPAPVHKPPIIIYQGRAPPVHVYEKPTNGYDTFDRRHDDIDPRTADGDSSPRETPIPVWLPDMQMPAGFQSSSMYVSDLTSGQVPAQSTIQTYILQEQPIPTEISDSTVEKAQLVERAAVDLTSIPTTSQTFQQTPIPASSVSMMFKLA